MLRPMTPADIPAMVGLAVETGMFPPEVVHLARKYGYN